jgi:hypothetical protein
MFRTGQNQQTHKDRESNAGEDTLSHIKCELTVEKNSRRRKRACLPIFLNAFSSEWRSHGAVPIFGGGARI